MPRDKRLFITVHNGMPDHPKVEGLTDAAFRLLVTVWCRCSVYMTDGAITESWWKKQKAAARRELLDAGLVEPSIAGDGVVVHDWDDHQLTTADIAQMQARKSAAAVKGNHERWHVGRGVHDLSCQYCVRPAANG